MFPMYVSRLNFIPRPFALMVSVPEHESASAWRDRFAAALPLASEVLIRPVKNSGRDVMPWLCTFRDDIIRYDIMLHVHTKASPQNYGILWNDFLLHNVCGSPAVVTGILRLFGQDKRLGRGPPPTTVSRKISPIGELIARVAKSSMRP